MTVSVYCAVVVANAVNFTPRVRDEGERIDPAFLPHVFERLRQAEGATKRTGLGLGLAIARHIVDLHHGEITAESEGRGKGTTFTIVLPLSVRQQRYEARRDEAEQRGRVAVR